MSLHLKPNEKIQVAYRQAEMVLLRPTLTIIIAIFVLWYFAIRYNIIEQHLVIVMISTIAIAGYGLYYYILWMLTTYTITSQRLVCTYRRRLFHSVHMETPLAQVSNVSYKTSGLFSALFGYGNVSVNANGLAEPIVLAKVHDARAVKDYLWDIAGSVNGGYTEN